MTYNTAILYNKQTSSYDAEAEKLRQSIVNSKSVVGPSEVGNTYYISPKGNDSNKGTSPSTAWRTLKNLQSTARFSFGDVVLFERGAVYRGSLYMASWVSYGAYGTGAKPAIYGSVRNYADSTLWEKTSKKNVWRLAVAKDTPDVGNIVFDHGKECASKGKKLSNTLSTDFDFYHDEANGYVYLYLSKGNPGELYDDIEVCVKQPVFGRLNGGEVKGVTIDNLCIKYSGSFGVVFSKTQDIKITNCEIGYIGGSMLNASVRYGNGIEFNSHVDNALVENNWIYQCYDAGYTNQGNGAEHNNITVRNNLIEYCNYNIEIFCKAQVNASLNGLIKDCVFEDNVLRFAGYGFGTKNRLGSNDSATSAICYWMWPQPSENVVFRNNVIDTSYRYLLVSARVNDTKNLGPTIKGNTWIQHNGPNSAVAHLGDGVLSSKGLEQMKTSVNKIDTAPAKVRYEG